MKPVEGAQVLVQSYPGGVDSLIYSDDGSTLKTNPIVTDEDGFFYFYAADGDYQFNVSGPLIQTHQVTDVTLGGSGGGGGGGDFTFVEGVVPTGIIDGGNTLFTLPDTPNPAASLDFYQNGQYLTSGVDYTLVGSAVTLIGAPEVGDVLIASYRISGGGGAFTFVDSVVPTGIIDGGNLIFTLPTTPNPASSLSLKLNGQYLTGSGVDYTLVGNTITYITAPIVGDNHVASYRS